MEIWYWRRECFVKVRRLHIRLRAMFNFQTAGSCVYHLQEAGWGIAAAVNTKKEIKVLVASLSTATKGMPLQGSDTSFTSPRAQNQFKPNNLYFRRVGIQLKSHDNSHAPWSPAYTCLFSSLLRLRAKEHKRQPL